MAVPEISEVGQQVEVGTFNIVCAICDERLPVQVTARCEELDDGDTATLTEPDLTDVWAHFWLNHAEEGGDG